MKQSEILMHLKKGAFIRVFDENTPGQQILLKIYNQKYNWYDTAARLTFKQYSRIIQLIKGKFDIIDVTYTNNNPTYTVKLKNVMPRGVR